MRHLYGRRKAANGPEIPRKIFTPLARPDSRSASRYEGNESGMLGPFCRIFGSAVLCRSLGSDQNWIWVYPPTPFRFCLFLWRRPHHARVSIRQAVRLQLTAEDLQRYLSRARWRLWPEPVSTFCGLVLQSVRASSFRSGLPPLAWNIPGSLPNRNYGYGQRSFSERTT